MRHSIDELKATAAGNAGESLSLILCTCGTQLGSGYHTREAHD